MTITTYTHQVLLIKNGTTLGTTHEFVDINRAFANIGNFPIVFGKDWTSLTERLLG
jgi:hypothetical protein